MVVSPVPASLTARSRTAELVWVHKRQQVLPGCSDKTQTCWVIQAAPLCVTQGLAGRGGCPLAQSAGMCLGARLLERSWIYGPLTKVLEFPKVATTFSLLLTIQRGCLVGKLFLRASSCTGNSQQQASESVQLLLVLCLLLICLPSHPGRLLVLHCLLLPLVQQRRACPCACPVQWLLHTGADLWVNLLCHVPV